MVSAMENMRRISSLLFLNYKLWWQKQVTLRHYSSTTECRKHDTHLYPYFHQVWRVCGFSF